MRYLIFLLFSLSAFSQSTVKEEAIDVVIGIDKIIKYDFVASEKVQVGNPNLISYELIPVKKEITFKGVKTGTTSVTLRNQVGDVMRKFKVRITSTDVSRLLIDLREGLKDVEGLEIGVRGNRVFVGGKIFVAEDVGKIENFLSGYSKDEVLVEYDLSPVAQRKIARIMQDEIKKQGMPNVTVRVVNKTYWLEGVVTSQGLKERATKVAELLLPSGLQKTATGSGRFQQVEKNIINNFISINEQKQEKPSKKLIKFTAQFVELTKDYSKVFGFEWQPTLGGDGGQVSIGQTQSGDVTTQSSNTLTATIGSLFPKLASAKTAGYARDVQSGMVVGEEGQDDIKITKETSRQENVGSGDLQQSVGVTIGFNLSIGSPEIGPKEVIGMGINLSVTSSVEGNATGTITNNIVTRINVKNKESAAIGGVSVSKSVTNYDKDPPGGGTDTSGGEEGDTTRPLFSFVRSKNYLTSKSQYVMFITPEILESASQGSKDIIRKFKRRGR